MVLARCLGWTKGTRDIPEALRHYERLRRERAAWLVRRSRLIGRIGQLENPALCWLRSLAFEAIPSRAYARQVGEVVSYEP